MALTTSSQAFRRTVLLLAMAGGTLWLVARNTPAQPSAERQQQVAMLAGEPVAMRSETSRSVETAIRSTRLAERAILNNLANAETIAFKRSSVRWVGGGEIVIEPDFGQGDAVATGKCTDLTIEGEGFLHVRVGDDVGDGCAYIRNGALFVSAEGELLIAAGKVNYRLQPSIIVPNRVNSGEILISQEGEISVRLPGQTGMTKIGQLQVARFNCKAQLRPFGDVMYLETEGSGPATLDNPGQEGAGRTMANFLEASNVEPAAEETALRQVRAMRARLEAAVR